MNNLNELQEHLERWRSENGDQDRATGRTGRMLLEAVIEASKGKVVHVKVESDDYAKDLMFKCMEIISSTFGYQSFEVTNHELKMIGDGSIYITDRKGVGISSGHFHEIEKRANKTMSDHYFNRERMRGSLS